MIHLEQCPITKQGNKSMNTVYEANTYLGATAQEGEKKRKNKKRERERGEEKKNTSQCTLKRRRRRCLKALSSVLSKRTVM